MSPRLRTHAVVAVGVWAAPARLVRGAFRWMRILEAVGDSSELRGSRPWTVPYSIRACALVAVCLSLVPHAARAVDIAVPGADAKALSPTRHGWNGKAPVSANEAIRALRQDPGIVLVDVRDPQAFARLHVPGALNLPIYALKAKAQLRARRLLLMGGGFAQAPLSRAADSLAEKGYGLVSVLDGGLLGWASAGGALEGDRAALSEARCVSPAELLAEKGSSDVSVVSLGVPEGRTARAWPDAVGLSLPFSREALHSRLGEDARRPGGPRRVVLVDTGGAGEAASAGLERDGLAEAGGVRLFHLRGGLDAYEALLQATDDRGGRAPKKVPGCSQCP